jgi:hypothetical protein
MRPLTLATGMIMAATLAACSGDSPTPTTMTAASGSGQSGAVATTLGAPIVVHVVDQNGAALSGVQVSFGGTGGIKVSPTLVNTDASGNASATVTLGTTIGADTVSAFVADLQGGVEFLLTANPGPPTSLVIVGGNNQTSHAGTLLINHLLVEVEDQYGNPVSGVTMDWITTDGVLTPALPLTSGTNGILQTAFTVPNTPSTATVTGTLHGTSLTAVFTEIAD